MQMSPRTDGTGGEATCLESVGFVSKDPVAVICREAQLAFRIEIIYFLITALMLFVRFKISKGFAGAVFKVKAAHGAGFEGAARPLAAQSRRHLSRAAQPYWDLAAGDNP